MTAPQKTEGTPIPKNRDTVPQKTNNRGNDMSYTDKQQKEFDCLTTMAELAERGLKDAEELRRDALAAAKSKVMKDFEERISVAMTVASEHNAILRHFINENATHEWEGKTVYHYEQKRNSFYRTTSYQMIKGIVEVRRFDTVLPANVRCGLPKLGQPFVRLLKKDGTPGKAISDRIPHYWSLTEAEAKQRAKQ